MKTAVLYSLPLLLLLVVTSSTTTSAKTLPFKKLPVVLDSHNLLLRSDIPYFMVHSIMDGGGVSPGDEYMVQSPDFGNFGTSVIVTPKDKSAKNITENTPVSIKNYHDNSLWSVAGFPGIGPYYISYNGTEGNLSTWFQIKIYNYYSYQLVFCPYTPTSCDNIVYDVVDGQRRLASNANTPNFPFVLVPDDGTRDFTAGKWVRSI